MKKIFDFILRVDGLSLSLISVLVVSVFTLILLFALDSCTESIDLYGVDSLHQHIDFESACECDTSFLHYNDDLSDITCE